MKIEQKKLIVKVVAGVAITPPILIAVWLFQLGAYGLGAIFLIIIIWFLKWIREKHESIGDINV